MLNRKRLLLCFLTTLILSPVGAVDFGLRYNFGLTSGFGGNWFETLEEAGSTGFNEIRPSLAFGGFVEFELSPHIIFAPELYYVYSRGISMRDGQDNTLRIMANHSIELVFPFARDFEFSDGTKAFRIMGGIQMLISPFLEQKIYLNNYEQTTQIKNSRPVSAGFIFGSGLEFRRKKKLSWLLDLRLLLPASHRIGIEKTDGSLSKFSTIELLLGTGIKF